MTLAVILVSIILTAPAPPLALSTGAQEAGQAPPASPPAMDHNTQDQGSTAAQNTSGGSHPPPAKPEAALSPSGQNPKTAKRARHKRKVTASDCNAAPAAAAGATASAGSTSPTPANGRAERSTAPPGAASAPSNCPPSKIVVRQGGASEPNIQLVGGPAGDQATQQRDTINRMLAAAERNLQKMGGQELAASKQDMVNQTQQFTEQAKAALAAEDFDRARTLAWKAQLLSEELARPEKK